MEPFDSFDEFEEKKKIVIKSAKRMTIKTAPAPKELEDIPALPPDAEKPKRGRKPKKVVE